MVQAVWNSEVIADSDDTSVVEGNHYFPRDAVDDRFLQESDHHSVCPWKGQASYYHIVVDGQTNRDAAWYYPLASDEAKRIEGRIAFWRGVQVR